jgi:hypothetical protein
VPLSGHHGEALNDLAVSVSGSALSGAACRTNRAAAVYELPEDYSGAGAAADASYAAGLAFLDRGSHPALTVEVFRCADAVQSDPEGYAA